MEQDQNPEYMPAEYANLLDYLQYFLLDLLVVI